MQFLLYSLGHIQKQINDKEIFEVKIGITKTTSFHEFQMQFNSSKQYLWKDFIKDYMEELLRKDVKFKEKNEQFHQNNFFYSIFV